MSACKPTLQHAFGKFAQLPGTCLVSPDEFQEVRDPLVDGRTVQTCQPSVKPENSSAVR